MKAIIFNSGYGNRMGEFTKTHHKSMAPMKDGETIFHRQLRILSEEGIKDFIITTGPFEDQLKAEAADFPELNIQFVRNDIFEEKVEDSLVGPVFIIDYPASICPLTKRKRSNPAIAERFELFVRGCELANAYTELNDPDLQEQLFRSQLEGQKDEDSMAKMDHDFIRALRYAMPPAGGLGIGIDRLTMMLTDTTSIREVILFPLLKPEVFE